jgi:hypothetical protein
VYNNAVAALKTLDTYGGVANDVPMIKAALNTAPNELMKVPGLDVSLGRQFWNQNLTIIFFRCQKMSKMLKI